MQYHSSSINYTDEGTGNIVVLLHGYLETHEIWGDFAKDLAQTFRVINIDIPGHGKSGKLSDIHTVEILAEAIDYLLTTLGIEKSFIIGHSMGGYSALAYLEKFPLKVSGLCLFHSTPFADTEEKKLNRSHDIELLLQGKKDVVFNNHVLKSFATDNLIHLADKVDLAKKIAFENNTDGIIALVEGMKIRPDRQTLLKKTLVPVMFILGKKDNYIPYEIMYAVAQRSPLGEALLLENSGHMGFLEEPGICLEALKSFIHQYHFEV